MEKQIIISVNEYNKLIDMHTNREELPEKIEVKKFTSKWWNWLKRASYSLFYYKKNIEQQKLIKLCINITASHINGNLLGGYWNSDLSDYIKENFRFYSKHQYEVSAYREIMNILNKK